MNTNYNNLITINKMAIKSYLCPSEYRKCIYLENNKSGIYCWTNLITGKIYIGSSINLKNRFYSYLSYKWLKTQSLKYNSKIYNALLKYGYSNFKLSILKYCDNDELCKWEQHYMDLLKPEYNILKFAGSRLSHRHSYATKLKLRSYKPT